ncbi:PAS domain-containing protein [Sneathiella glossodoripedis]|uniref:PAS domain-containing protein n=1 Tax=Sneathiella glossodoripedis TaxID=418853 RepID=UPI00046E643E|nr:PAS domain-containing protein [Sneathiella glossodoripedis]
MQHENFEGLKSTIVDEGLKYWTEKCGNRLMPRWADINPAEIKHLLPNLVLIHVEYDPLDFIERITGDVILSHSAQNSMGKRWRTYEGRGPDSKIWQSMEEVVNTCKINRNSIPYVGPQKYFKGIETVICPISEDGTTVTRLLTFVDYIARTDSQVESEVALKHISRFTLPR